jgi:4-aminobutyrate aminotransferase-like enzyme
MARARRGSRPRGKAVGITLKIRPPLVFQRQHADQLVETLEKVLAAA